MAYKCSKCSFIDVNAQDTPKECVSCGEIASMSYVDYQPKTPVSYESFSATETLDSPAQQLPAEPEEPIEGALGDVFGE